MAPHPVCSSCDHICHVWFGWEILVFTLTHALTPVQFDIGYLVQSVILAPFAESLIQAILLSTVFLVIVKNYKDRWIKSSLYIFTIIAVSVLITGLHFPQTPISFLNRFILFNITGILFYTSKQNIVPMITAHFAWNALLII